MVPVRISAYTRSVELDGGAFHDNAAARDRDATRDLVATVGGVDQAVGQHVSELSNSFAQMLEMGAVLEDVAGTIHVHPTMGEAFHEASLRALGHAIHI